MGNIHQLRTPDPERVVQIRKWFMEQGLEPAGHVAAVSVSITTDKRVQTQGCCIEPEHAAVMLDELKALVARLEGFVHDQAPDLLRRTAVHQDMASNVIPLHR